MNSEGKYEKIRGIKNHQGSYVNLITTSPICQLRILSDSADGEKHLQIIRNRIHFGKTCHRHVSK